MYFPTIAGSNRFKEIVNGEYPVYCRVLGMLDSQLVMTEVFTANAYMEISFHRSLRGSKAFDPITL